MVVVLLSKAALFLWRAALHARHAARFGNMKMHKKIKIICKIL